MGDALVAVSGLSKRYGRHLAVEGVSLVLEPGEIVALLGANGAGKTTTLRLLAGLLRADGGGGQVLGFDLLREAARVRRHVGYMAQRLSLFPDLSVLENLRFRADIYGLAAPKRVAAQVLEAYGLEGHARDRAATLSGGWARRLQLAASLVHAPKLLLLDEPTVGLDVPARREIWRRVEALAAGGSAVLVCTHDLAEAGRCTRATFFSGGRCVAHGSAAEMVALAEAAP